MYTEDEARTKRCCVGFPCGIPDDSNGVQGVQRLCVASGCMAWRWVSLKVTPEYLDAVRVFAEATGEKTPFAKAARAVADDPETHGLPSEPFSGYCGRAGKP